MGEELQKLEQYETMYFNAKIKVHLHEVFILFSANSWCRNTCHTRMSPYSNMMHDGGNVGGKGLGLM